MELYWALYLSARSDIFWWGQGWPPGFQGSVSFPVALGFVLELGRTVVFRIQSLGTPLLSGVIAENVKPDIDAALERNYFGHVPTMLFLQHRPGWKVRSILGHWNHCDSCASAQLMCKKMCFQKAVLRYFCLNKWIPNHGFISWK